MISSAKIIPNEKYSPIFPHILGHCPAQTFSLPHSFRVVLGGLLFKKKILNSWLWWHSSYFRCMLFCLYVCAPWAYLVPARNQAPGTRTGVGFLGTDGWEFSWGCWEPNLNPLEEQLSALNAKPFHQSLALFLTICTIYNCPSSGTLWLLLSPAVESQSTMLSSLQKSLKGNSNFAQLV